MDSRKDKAGYTADNRLLDSEEHATFFEAKRYYLSGYKRVQQHTQALQRAAYMFKEAKRELELQQSAKPVNERAVELWLNRCKKASKAGVTARKELDKWLVWNEQRSAELDEAKLAYDAKREELHGHTD